MVVSSSKSLAVLSALLLWSNASALDILLKKMTCESRAVKLSFDYICDGDNLCTFGDVETMEGKFTYYGLVDAFNATDEDSLIMNANLYFHLTGYTHEQNLIENIEMPVCNDALTAGENNENGACPNDGTYAFDTTYNMPEVDSDYLGWASSGWAGEIVVEMHLARSMDLVGLCTMKFETYVTGSFEKGAFSTVPSAKTTAFAVLGSLALVFVCCMYTCCRKPKSTRDDALLAADDETPTIDYHQASKVGRGGRRTKNKKDGTYLM